MVLVIYRPVASGPVDLASRRLEVTLMAGILCINLINHCSKGGDIRRTWKSQRRDVLELARIQERLMVGQTTVHR